jgi:hypothetical protein
MKKYLILAISTLIGSSFTYKTILKNLTVSVLITDTFKANSQNYGVAGNAIDNSWSLYETNSPTNVYGNRYNLWWVDKNSVHYRNKQFFYDTLYLKNHPMYGHDIKMTWVDVSTGEMFISKMDSVISKMSPLITPSWTNVIGSPALIPTNRQLTINGTSFDLSTNRTWSLTTTSVGESGNLYYTDVRSRNAVSLTTTGTSGAASYNSSTGIINVPQYATSVVAGNEITIAGSAPSFTVSKTKRQLTLTGTTNASGIVTFTWAAFSATPNIQMLPSYPSGNKETSIFNAAPTTTGCSFLVQLRADVLGLLPSYSAVNAREVKILVTEE